jgi:hypothetical protein
MQAARGDGGHRFAGQGWSTNMQRFIATFERGSVEEEVASPGIG